MEGATIILYVILALIVVIAVVALILKIIFIWKGFSKELNYLNIEIGRTEGPEREYWIKRKRQLMLSLIPFVKY